jgi:hypothetical protein
MIYNVDQQHRKVEVFGAFEGGGGEGLCLQGALIGE